MLDKLSFEDFAPVRSRSAPDSGGAKSSESVVGVGGARGSNSDGFGVSTGVFLEGAGGRVGAWVSSSDTRVGAEARFAAAFFGGIDPGVAENVRLK
jgi:hypothetical protein